MEWAESLFTPPAHRPALRKLAKMIRARDAKLAAVRDLCEPIKDDDTSFGEFASRVLAVIERAWK